MRYANCVSRLTGCNLGLHVKGDLLNCTCKWQQVREWRTTKMFSWTYYKYSMCLWKFWSGTASDTADRLGDERAKIGPNWRAGLRHRKTAAEAGRGNISNSPHSSCRSTRKATIEVDCGGFVDARTFFSFGFLSSCISGRLHYHARSAIPSGYARIAESMCGISQGVSFQLHPLESEGRRDCAWNVEWSQKHYYCWSELLIIVNNWNLPGSSMGIQNTKASWWGLWGKKQKNQQNS